MTNNKEFKVYENGFKEGYLFAAQQVASAILHLIDNHPSWMLEPERKQSKASIKLATRHLLERRGIIPYSYDVIRGKADKVELNFEM